ncbi:hypothetical protein Q3G72_011644 [Acer saccharum]|nr:hypothetical protein Q3G72_011644 [Acer saccharum]
MSSQGFALPLKWTTPALSASAILVFSWSDFKFCITGIGNVSYKLIACFKHLQAYVGLLPSFEIKYIHAISPSTFVRIEVARYQRMGEVQRGKIGLYNNVIVQEHYLVQAGKQLQRKCTET